MTNLIEKVQKEIDEMQATLKAVKERREAAYKKMPEVDRTWTLRDTTKI